MYFQRIAEENIQKMKEEKKKKKRWRDELTQPLFVTKMQHEVSFKGKITGLNSKFSFSLTSCHK